MLVSKRVPKYSRSAVAAWDEGATAAGSEITHAGRRPGRWAGQQQLDARLDCCIAWEGFLKASGADSLLMRARAAPYAGRECQHHG